MMPTSAAVIGASIFLVLFICSIVGTVFFAIDKVLPGVLACLGMAAIIGYAIVANDWPRVWKPLFTRSK